MKNNFSEVRKIKKLMALILALVMVVCCFAACGAKNGNADGTRISELEQALESERNALADLRKEYKERFFSGGENPPKKPDKKGSEEIQINDLFKEE